MICSNMNFHSQQASYYKNPRRSKKNDGQRRTRNIWRNFVANFIVLDLDAVSKAGRFVENIILSPSVLEIFGFNRKPITIVNFDVCQKINRSLIKLTVTECYIKYEWNSLIRLYIYTRFQEFYSLNYITLVALFGEI